MKPKSLLLSILYMVVLVIILLLLNVALVYFFDNVIFPALNWFNRTELWVKVAVVIFGGVFVMKLAFSLFNLMAMLMSRLVLHWFEFNSFNTIVSFIFSFLNAIYIIVQLWKVPQSYNFWVVIELLMLSYFTLLANYITVMREDKVANKH